MRITLGCYALFWSSTLQNSPCTATYLPSQKLSKKSKKYGLTHEGYSLKKSPPVLLSQQKFIHQLCGDTEYYLDDFPRAITDRDGYE